jgi:predicted alpha/beta-hydrolase family hydrolase
MAKPLFLFAPGAGAPSTSGWMQGWRARLETLGTVVTLDYPYMLAGRRSPDPLPKLIAAHRAALAEARKRRKGRIVLIGKSMGGRVGCHVALEDSVDGIVCLGYPLKAMGKGKLRDEVLVALRTPILLIQGEKDNLCPLDLLAETRKRMKAASTLFIVEGGNHSLAAPKTALKRAGRSQDDVDQEILQTIATFVTRLG